jgi:transcriptional regulator with XRE-family HTH domain
MPEMNRKIVGENLRNLRDAIGLTQTDLGDLLSISKRSMANLEAGVEFDTFELINKLLDFYGLTFNDVGYELFLIPTNFREYILSKHLNNGEYSVLLNKIPSIPYAIKYNLLKGDFLNDPKQTYQIKEYFENIGWKWTGPALATALKRLENNGITIKPHPVKKGTSEYQKQS